jgi:hypothetical protein
LTRKEGGPDHGKLYAQKVIFADRGMQYDYDFYEQCTERLVHQAVSTYPFLVGLHYAFLSMSGLFLLVGEYIRNSCPFDDV